MLAFVVKVLIAFTVNTNVAALSQPTALVKCAVCVPAALKVKPFHEYGKAEGQMLMLVLDVDVAFTVNTRIAALSQPTAFVV